MSTLISIQHSVSCLFVNTLVWNEGTCSQVLRVMPLILHAKVYLVEVVVVHDAYTLSVERKMIICLMQISLNF